MAIVFIDAECVLCENIARLILSIDRKGKLYVAPLGGITYQNLTGELPPSETYQYVKLYNGNTMYVGPQVVFELARIIGFPYNLVLIFRFLPNKLQWALYNFIAKNRYNWFGKKEHCSIGSPKFHKKILP